MSDKKEDDADPVSDIILGGFLIATAVGVATVWFVCKAFGGFKQGEKVTADDLKEAGYEPPRPQISKFDKFGPEKAEELRTAEANGHNVCEDCGAIDPPRCTTCFNNTCGKCYAIHPCGWCD